MGEKYPDRRERNRQRGKNAVYSDHYILPSSAANALEGRECSDHISGFT